MGDLVIFICLINVKEIWIGFGLIISIVCKYVEWIFWFDVDFILFYFISWRLDLSYLLLK